MATSIRPAMLNHFNLVLPDFHHSLSGFRELYGADFLMDIPGQGYHAGLFEIGRVIFEIFSPDHWLMSARFGPHFVGVEYKANMDEVREAIVERGIRIVRDVGLALHTHPEDTFGVAFEFYDGAFHDNTYPLLGGNKMRSAEFWEKEHPLGLTGLKRYSLAVADCDGAVGFIRSFLAGTVAYREERPVIGARVVGMAVADSVIEIMAPVKSGQLQNHLYRYGDGIRSVVFAVKDMDRVIQYFRERQIELQQGDAAGELAVPAGLHPGVRFEFSE